MGSGSLDKRVKAGFSEEVMFKLRCEGVKEPVRWRDGRQGAFWAERTQKFKGWGRVWHIENWGVATLAESQLVKMESGMKCELCWRVSLKFRSAQHPRCGLTWKQGLWRCNWLQWSCMSTRKDCWEFLGSKENKSVNPKGNKPWTCVGRVDAETLILWPPDAKSWLTGKDPDAGRDWRKGEKGATEDEMVGWHHWLYGHESEQIPGDSKGQGSLVYCSLRGFKESDMTLMSENNHHK